MCAAMSGMRGNLATSMQLADSPNGKSQPPKRADDASCSLLRAICRLEPGVSAQEIGRLAAEVREWDSLIAMAREHRVAPLLYRDLAGAAPDIPPSVLALLRRDYEANAFQSLANAIELLALLEAFERESIQAMPFKGVVLGASAYGDLTTRPAGDLDLIVHHRDLERASVILLRRGFELDTPLRANGQPVFDANHEFQFKRPADGVIVELRWRLELVYSRSTRNLGMDWVWPSRRTATLAGAEVPNLGPETALLMLCMHGSKHAWSRLIWIRDVAQLLTACPELDWEASIREASRAGLWRALALGLLLAHRVCGARIPDPVLRKLDADATARRLASHFDDCLFVAPGSDPQGGVPYWMHLLDFRDRLHRLLSPEFLRPNEKDIAAVPLPKFLYPLYFLVRPFRILTGRSARH